MPADRNRDHGIARASAGRGRSVHPAGRAGRGERFICPDRQAPALAALELAREAGETMQTLKVNGKLVKVDVEGDMPLLWVLRCELGLTGTKFGCGLGICGACTVHVDGEPELACQ